MILGLVWLRHHTSFVQCIMQGYVIIGLGHLYAHIGGKKFIACTYYYGGGYSNPTKNPGYNPTVLKNYDLTTTKLNYCSITYIDRSLVAKHRNAMEFMKSSIVRAVYRLEVGALLRHEPAGHLPAFRTVYTVLVLTLNNIRLAYPLSPT